MVSRCNHVGVLGDLTQEDINKKQKVSLDTLFLPTYSKGSLKIVSSAYRHQNVTRVLPRDQTFGRVCTMIVFMWDVRKEQWTTALSTLKFVQIVLMVRFCLNCHVMITFCRSIQTIASL